MTRIPLTLGKHYLLIDSPISFFLIDNEENSVYRPSGVWQLDTWKLLPEKYQRDHPVYTLSIEYDESKLDVGKEVLIRESDIDLGDGVAGVSGQSVMLTGINDSLLPISVSISNFPDNQKVNISNLPDVQKVAVQNNPTEIAVNNFPDNQKVNISNLPDVQKVAVQNNPTEIAVNNFPDNQKVNISNLPDVQNANFCLRSLCGFPNGEPLSFSQFLNFLDTHQNIYIDCLVFRSAKGNFLVSTWSLIKATAEASVWVGVGRKFTDNTLDFLSCTTGSTTDECFSPFYHVI